MNEQLFSLPIVAPAFRPPVYRYNHIRRLSVVLETEPERLKSFIPAPLEYVTNRYVVWIEHRVDQNPGPAPAAYAQPYDTYEASVDIPVRFKGMSGTHIPLMYVPPGEADFSRALAGRELQGIGKKISHFYWDERVIDNQVVARMDRNGKPVIDMVATLDDSQVELPTAPPVIQVKILPNIDGTTLDVHKVVALDSWEVNTIASSGARVDRIEFGTSDEDPLYRLKPTRIIGAKFTVWSGATLQPCGRDLEDLLKG